MEDRKVTLIYLEDAVLLSKKRYHGWKECQEAFADSYKANMAPMTQEEILSFLMDDWGDEDSVWPFTRQDIAEFYLDDEVMLLSSITK